MYDNEEMAAVARPGKKGGVMLSREQQFLKENGDKFDAETRRAISAGELQYADADLYVRKRITSSAFILDTGNVRKIGVSNIDKNQLADFQYLALGRLRVAYATDAAITDPAGVIYNNMGVALPAALANGEIVFRLDDKPIYEGRLAKFFNLSGTAASYGIQGFLDTVELDAVRLIRPSNGLIIQVNLADGIALAAGNHFLEVNLLGAMTRRR